MEISKTTTKFSYKIEPKADGGFIARPSDPSMEAIEGATKEEVEQKIQDMIKQAVLSRFSNFKFGGVNVNVKTNFNVTTRHANASDAGTLLSSEAEQAGMIQPSPGEFAGPTTKSSDTTGTLLRVIAAVIALGAIVYFLLNH